MPKDEFDWDPGSDWLVPIEHDNEDAGQRCARALLKAMREPSKTASKGYLAAARFFALAATKEDPHA
jgi:hypothetical protein